MAARPGPQLDGGLTHNQSEVGQTQWFGSATPPGWFRVEAEEILGADTVRIINLRVFVPIRSITHGTNTFEFFSPKVHRGSQVLPQLPEFPAHRDWFSPLEALRTASDLEEQLKEVEVKSTLCLRGRMEQTHGLRLQCKLQGNSSKVAQSCWYSEWRSDRSSQLTNLMFSD